MQQATVNGVPRKRWEDSTFETFELARNPSLRTAYEQCAAVSERRAWCAFLVGPPGTGKTHLAIAAMHRYGGGARFWKVPDYLDWLRHMRYDEGWDEFHLTKSYRNEDFLLVLDDLGVEKQTEWVDEQLYKILDSRYDNELPTIITSNSDPKDISPRLQSRYREGMVVCKGTDQRRRKG